MCFDGLKLLFMCHMGVGPDSIATDMDCTLRLSLQVFSAQVDDGPPPNRRLMNKAPWQPGDVFYATRNINSVYNLGLFDPLGLVQINSLPPF